MKALTLEEFATNLRVRGDWRESDFGTEILELIDMRETVEEPYYTLCDDVAHYAPADLKENTPRALEWLGDRSGLLEEIERQFTDAGREPEGTEDVGDVVRGLLEDLAEAEAILEAAGVAGEGTFLDQLRALAERPAPLEYDL